MIQLRSPFINQKRIISSPCQDLFIYYLNGRLKPDTEIFQDNFIGNWEEDGDTFLFFSSPAIHQVQNLLCRQPHLNYIDSYSMPYKQWLGETFNCFEHGKFRVIPAWDISEEHTRAITEKLQIVLDPGLVFGTGTHPTTRDCLKALELAVSSKDVHTVLDLGTGTGLLAIAAARLGSQRIVAVDLNLLAAKTAARNVRFNRLQNQVTVVQGKAEDLIACPADLIIANLHYDVMRHLVHSEGFAAKKRFILSGLLRSEAKDIAASLASHPTKILQQWIHNGVWYTFYGKRFLNK
jgi:ribosomal protein L11 methyltransferase